ncbi:putative lipid II flippase FtsW [Marininema halotolerans]|uniref:Probable peptidoglycan glycosyltransferase FtsW n=1 Tax=Marininema halotolerans TaxID=1155944 RepID=A0A1I6SX74_9BACL|nr:putative lipid II flippase FtsW [Marininema halotolerans]SFS81500.1 cell division protein FtsW [Marininema halotolerans]
MRGKPDFWMMFIIFLLTGFGLVMVFSSSYYEGLTRHHDSYFFFKKQLSWSFVALVMFFIMSNIPYTIYQKKVGLILAISVFLLLLVYIPALSISLNGARRWLQLGPVGFQPSEIAKIAAVIYTAAIMTKKQNQLDHFSRGLLPPIIVLSFISALIVFEPHFSSIVILLISCMTIIFVAGARVKHLLLLASTGIPFLIYIMLLQPYRIKRWAAVYDPWKNPSSDGHQIIQSLFAIGPGGLFGKGLGNSIQKLAYLPMAQTDFIFSIIAEELGFLGGLLLVTLYVAFILRGIRIAVRAPDLFGHLLGIGIITMFATQTLLNLGVVTAMLPPTGIPLPFISYGGTSLVICMMAAGILMNISRYQTVASTQQQPTSGNRPQRRRPHLVTSNFKG